MVASCRLASCAATVAWACRQLCGQNLQLPGRGVDLGAILCQLGLQLGPSRFSVFGAVDRSRSTVEQGVLPGHVFSGLIDRRQA